jgi:hypothetical protein
MCLDTVITTDKKELPKRKIVYKCLDYENRYIFDDTKRIPFEKARPGMKVVGNYDDEPFVGKIASKKGEMIFDGEDEDRQILIKRDDKDGHSNGGMFEEDHYWWVDAIYKPHDVKKSMEYVSLNMNTIIKDDMIDDNKDAMIDGRYPSGYHGWATLAGAKDWGGCSRIGKFVMTRIVAYGEQKGNMCYVARRLKFLGIVGE